MLGPFPGMAPFLEDPRYWRGLHNRLIAFTEAALNASLPPGFAANAEERVYVVPPERPIYPDVMVVQRMPDSSVQNPGGATTLLEPETDHGILTAYPEEIHESFIEIRTGDNWEQVVTILEFLSPANKAAGSVGREEYLQKQNEALHSATHLLEIDLLRGGQHTVAAPLESLRQRGRWDYLACLHRSTQRYQFEYWFCTVRQPLPEVKVPLTAGVAEVQLSLQDIFNQAYDAGPYQRRVDYRAAPALPLNAEEAAWMDTLLQAKGLRP